MSEVPRRFHDGQRVRVLMVDSGSGCAYGVPVFGLMGTVRRIRRCDDGAWVELDELSTIPDVHPFPADDETRSKHVLTYPNWCDWRKAK